MAEFISFCESYNSCLLRLKNVLVFFAVFCLSNAGAQKATGADQHIIAQDLLFEQFFSKNGLPDDRVRSLFQDSRGLIWIGTQNGVSRFDGYNFKKFYHSSAGNSISANWANAISEDSNKNIWIGTKDGLNRYDAVSEKFYCFINDKNNVKSISGNEVRTLHFDNSGRLWIGTNKGLNRFNAKLKSFDRFDIYPLNTEINKIIKSYGDFIWVATKDGLVHYNTKNNQFKFFEIKVKSNAYGDKFWSMFEDNKDLYITTGANGIVKLPFNEVSGSYNNYEYFNDFSQGTLDGIQVFDICKSNAGDIWLATANGIAKITKFRTKERTIKFYKNNPLNAQSISNDLVYSVFVDKTNVLWCGTDFGLNKLDLHLMPFEYYSFTNKAYKDQIRSVAVADGNSIWLGTSKNGLFSYNTITGKSKSYRFSDGFFNFNRSLLITENQVWNGSLGGVFKINDGSVTSLKEVEGHTVFSMLKDSKQNIWVGTNNGLYKILPNGQPKNFSLNSKKTVSVKYDYIRALYEDHKGNIWVGFENSALACFDPVLEKYTKLISKNNSNFSGANVYTITEYPKNTLWVGSESGLNKIIFSKSSGFSIKNYYEAQGLPDKSVNGIIADDKGNLWVSTIKGLAKFNIKTETFQTYLSNLHFHSSCYQKYNDHCFLFGGADGFVLFNPNFITKDTITPKIILSDLRLFNKPVSIGEKINGDVVLQKSIGNTDRIVLDYYNNQFSIEFAALHYSNPLNNRYAYKLEGFNDKWTYVNSSNKSATYTNLDPGTYVFLVKASNYSGKWSNTPKSLIVTVLPPPWKTWWARAAYIIIFNILLYILIKYILIQSKQRQLILFEQLEKEQLKNMNQMRVKFFTDISHEFRTPLSLIVGPIEDILSLKSIDLSVKNKAQLIYRNCKKLLYLIDELMTFQKMEQGMLHLKTVNADLLVFITEVYENFLPFALKKGIDFKLTAEEADFSTSFDPGKMEMVINNLLFNAFKFSKENGHVTISVGKCKRVEIPSNVVLETDDWICIAIMDEGKGLSEADASQVFERFFSDADTKGTGVGLSLTKNLIELHNGVITVKSVPGEGTLFNVFLPVVQDQLADYKVFEYEPEYDVSSLIDDPILNEMEFQNRVADTESFTVLVVDDNPELLDYLEMIFQEMYQVQKAENGLIALEKIGKNMPDLIISDLMMPEMDGIELCNAVKNDINTSHIPFLLLTAKSAVESEIQGLKTGADDYVSKPFSPEVLKLKVKKLIEMQKRLVEKFKADGGVVIPKNIAQNPLNEIFLQKVVDHIMANLSNDEFSVEELGSEIGMSRSNLFRKLKAITGQTPIEFIYFVRLNQAMELLLQRKLNISEIAYEVGFKNPSSFTKAFKKQFGKAPSEYLGEVLNKHKP